MSELAAEPGPASFVVRGSNVLAKTILLAMLFLVVMDPDWGNLEGKAPMVRAVTYPLLAFAVPALWWLTRRRGAPYPWVADLCVTIPAFSDILGNRLDLYDRIVWFDDWMHLVNTGLRSAAFVLLTLERSATLVAVVERSVAFGLTVALGWEIGEYFAFVTESSEKQMAYQDTLGDLGLGWLGAVVAALAVFLARRDTEVGSIAPGADAAEPVAELT
jgi:hypothetical protein